MYGASLEIDAYGGGADIGREIACRYPHQNFSEWEHAIVMLGHSAGYSDLEISRWLRRPANSIWRHRRISPTATE
jgi:hypothetical protein